MIFVWMVPLPALVPSRIRSPRRCPARDIAAKANNEAAEIVLQEVWSRQTSLTNPSTLGIMFSTIGGNPSSLGSPGGFMFQLLNRLWMDEKGQDIAEYAVMLAVILVIVIGTVKLIGTNSNNVFSSVASNIQ
jgi:Flp pilus assembly pilin Flp